MSADDLAQYVRANAEDTAFVASCWAQAWALVGQHIGSVTTVPQEVIDGCMLTVGSELYHRRQAPSGIAQFATPDASPVRLARDPMTSAYPVLAPFLGAGLA